MADNNGSNSVAIVAIIILVIAALGIGYYFMKQGTLDSGNTSKVQVNVPTSSEKPAEPSEKPAEPSDKSSSQY